MIRNRRARVSRSDSGLAAVEGSPHLRMPAERVLSFSAWRLGGRTEEGAPRVAGILLESRAGGSPRPGEFRAGSRDSPAWRAGLSAGLAFAVARLEGLELADHGWRRARHQRSVAKTDQEPWAQLDLVAVLAHLEVERGIEGSLPRSASV